MKIGKKLLQLEKSFLRTHNSSDYKFEKKYQSTVMPKKLYTIPFPGR
jgi:hypothetical protein